MSVDNLRKAVDLLIGEAKAFENAHSELHSEIGKLRQAVEEIEGRTKQRNEELAALRKGNTDIEGRKRELLSQVAALTAENEEWEKRKALLNKQLEDLRSKKEEEKRAVEEMRSRADQAMKEVASFKTMEASLEGYKTSLGLIAEWVPSQNENISVLVALSEYENLSQAELANKAKIGPKILTEKILPKLIEQGLVVIENDIVNLAD